MKKFIVLFILFISVNAYSFNEYGDGTEAFFVGGMNLEYLDFSTDGSVCIRGTGGTDDTSFCVDVDGTYPVISSDVDNILGLAGGLVEDTKRITASTYTILVTDRNVFFDTTSGDITPTLPAGVDGQKFNLYNTGANDVILTPNGLELIDGANATKTFAQGVLTITYETTDGWW